MRISDWSSDVCSSDLELNRLQAHAGQAEFELEVLGADRPPRQHLELTVEQRLGEALSPRPAIAQGAGIVDVEGVGRQLAVAGDGFVQRFGRDHRGGGFEEGRFEVREVRLRQAQARGHRVASERSEENTSELQSLMRLSY